MTDNERRESIQNILAPFLVGAAVFFGFAVMASLLEFGYNAGGDDVVHMAFHHEQVAILVDQHKLFGWSYLFGLGAPIFLFRPPLQYIAVSLLHMLTFGETSINLVHKFSYVFCLSIYAATIYFMMRKFEFKPLTSACAGLFAITPISMWGHTVDAYCRLGIAKQLIAITIFPLAFGMLHATVTRGKRVLPTAVIIALCFLSHPYMPFTLVLLCGVYMGLILLANGWKPFITACYRMFCSWALTGLLLAFYLVPHYTSKEIQMLEFSSTWRHGFEVICGTTAQTINHYLNGGLLDTTKWGLFGGGEWGWQSNSHTNRWPILTLMSLVGIVVTIQRRRKFNYAYMLLAFFFTFFIFLGPDDVPLLDFMPFQSQFQYIHAVFALDLFAMCLAGIGLAALVDYAMKGVQKFTQGKLAPRTATIILAATGLVVVGLAIYSPYQDRWKVGEVIVQKKMFDTHNRKMLDRAYRIRANKGYQEILDRLLEDPKPGRVYAAPYGAATGQELFYFSILPALCDRTDVICGFFSAEVAGVNKTVIEFFRKQIPRSVNLIKLLNIRYLVCARANDRNFTQATEYADLNIQNSHWSMWRVRDDFSHFELLGAKPIIVVAGIAEWRELCHLWLDAYMETKEPSRFPFLVYAGDHAEELFDWNTSQFSDVIMLKHGAHLSSDMTTHLKALADDGHTIVSQFQLEDIPHQRIRFISDMPFSKFMRDAIVTGSATETLEEREKHGATITTDQNTYVFIKIAYYQSWKAKLNGESIEHFEMSPGYNAVIIPAGTHELTLTYEGPNNYSVGLAVTLVSFLGSLAITLALPFWRRKNGDLPPIMAGNISSEKLNNGNPLGTNIIIAISFFSLATGYVREQFLKIPVPVRPSVYSEHEMRITLDWNLLTNTNATYDVQVSDKRNFKRIVFEKFNIREKHARKEHGLSPGRKYWWRMRSKIEGKHSPWSIPIPFYSAEDSVDTLGLDPRFVIEPQIDKSDKEGIRIRGATNLPNGTRLYARIFDRGSGKHYQSTGITVRRGQLKGLIREPKKGWPTNVAMTVSMDYVPSRQRYPVSDIMGSRGETLLRHGVGEGHRITHGITSETEAEPKTNPRISPMTLPGEGRWKAEIRAAFGSNSNLYVLGKTTLPNYSKFYVTAARVNGVDPVNERVHFGKKRVTGYRRTADVRNGEFRVAIPVNRMEPLRIRADFDPDRQYESVRKKMGFSGEAIAAQGVPEENRLFGLRVEQNIGLVESNLKPNSGS